MAFFQKKVVSNALTKLIDQNPDIDLEKVLLHDDLSPTIRNESEVLYKRILLKSDKPWIYKIFDYALFDKNPPKKFKEDNEINQINKNAANFLENCGKKFLQYFADGKQKDEKLIENRTLRKYLKETITKFIGADNKTNTNPMYAGHFQRFIENFLRWDALDPVDTIPELTLFLVNNCLILAYQQLITRIICDYGATIDKDIIYGLLTQMLNRSYIAVKYLRNNSNQKPTETALTVSMATIKRQKLNDDNQPLNIKKEPFPLVDVIFDKSENVEDLNGSDIPRIPWKEGINRTKENKIKYKKNEDAEFEAFLLIMSIRNSLSEQTTVVDYFRDDDEENNFPLIQALLYCGTRSPVKSLVSLEAFRLLSIIFDGSITLDIEPWKNTEDEKSELEFYNDYADDMIFDPTCLTYKMIHALPVFWNHRYNIDEYEMSKEEKEKIDTSDYYPDKNKKHFRSREKGETALEILQPCLLCEPPISSQLIYSCTSIFIRLSRLVRDIQKDKPITDEKIDLLVKIDGIVLDFNQHHFVYGIKYPVTSLSNLIISKAIIPLPPIDKQYQKEEKVRRTVLNGFVVDFYLRMTSMKTNPFFQVDGDVTVTQMGRIGSIAPQRVVDFFIYKDLSNFDKLKESTLFNIPIHSEFCFVDDENDIDEDDEDEGRSKVKITVRVDEMEDSIDNKLKKSSDKKQKDSIDDEKEGSTNKQSKKLKGSNNKKHESSDDEENDDKTDKKLKSSDKKLKGSNNKKHESSDDEENDDKTDKKLKSSDKKLKGSKNKKHESSDDEENDDKTDKKLKSSDKKLKGSANKKHESSDDEENDDKTDKKLKSSDKKLKGSANKKHESSDDEEKESDSDGKTQSKPQTEPPKRSKGSIRPKKRPTS